jgi:methylenetetrahydrofolate--tRNA-(uracil-5-)-methyltransferase
MSPRTVTVVGGGLAGSEAAWQIAEHGHDVVLVEMRPGVPTGAHRTDGLAELVCSNSLGSTLPDRASGILMRELEALGSLLLRLAREAALPAGGALAVDRERFSRAVTHALSSHPRVCLMRAEAQDLPAEPAVVASGPLTSPALSKALALALGEEHLYFYDALAPIVEADSIDRSIAFRGSRFGRGREVEGDYLNCPLDRHEYEAFVEALVVAERIDLRRFEAPIAEGVRAGPKDFFEGCLPIEVIAERGRASLAFGPLRPIGLTDPRTGKRPHAVVQLRQDNAAASLYNLVGLQTNLTEAAQRQVLRLIPGLAGARFARYGRMHRNTFVNAPRLLEPTLRVRGRPALFLAGQITGVEGYLGNIATGLLAGVNVSRSLSGKPLLELPAATMVGALCGYVTRADGRFFQPMKANLGILEPLIDRPRARPERAQEYADQSGRAIQSILASLS